MKKTKILTVMIVLLSLVSCTPSQNVNEVVSRGGEIVIATHLPKLENNYDDSDINSPKLKMKTLSDEQVDSLYLFGIFDYAVYEFENWDFSEFTIFIEIYKDGKLINQYDLIDVDRDEVSGELVEFAIKPTYDDGVFTSIKNDYFEWHETTSNEIGIPFDKAITGSSGYSRIPRSIEKGKEIALYYNGFVDAESKGFYDIDFNDYTEDDLQGFDYCYIVKCVFD